MQVVEVTVSSLKPYKKNARTHSAEQVTEIAESIKKFGFNNPILIDAENTILAGHGRLEGAKQAGLERVPTIQLGHLSKEEARAYILADNQLALNAGWDYDLLESELSDISVADDSLVGLLGFSDDYLNSILATPVSGENSNKKTKTVEGAKEYSEESFSDFDNQCPKCSFEWDDK